MPYILLLVFLLTACGGNGDSPAPVLPPVIPPAIIPPPVVIVTPPPICVLDGICDISAEVLMRVNALRTAGQDCGGSKFPPATPLVWNTLVQKAAYQHSLDMATKNYFSHTSPSGITFSDRLSSVGYNFSAAGENIAAGSFSVESTITMWKLSPGHCQNMMNPSFHTIGVGYAFGSSASYGIYWTMNLTS